MPFSLRKYQAPDFTRPDLANAPDVTLREAPTDGIAPAGFHAMSIYPEYFKIRGELLLAKESRMDCVPVYRDGEIHVVEFRLLRKGNLVVTGRTENAEEGIYVHPHGFGDRLSYRFRSCFHSFGHSFSCLSS